MSSRVTLMFAAVLMLVLLSPTRARGRRAGRVDPADPVDPVDHL